MHDEKQTNMNASWTKNVRQHCCAHNMSMYRDQSNLFTQVVTAMLQINIMKQIVCNLLETDFKASKHAIHSLSFIAVKIHACDIVLVKLIYDFDEISPLCVHVMYNVGIWQLWCLI